MVAQKILIALRPPRLRRFGGFAKFVDGAATPPHEEGNIRFDLTFCAKPVRAASPMRGAWRGPNSLGLTWGHNELLSDPKHLSCIGSISFSTRFPVGGDRCRGGGLGDQPDSASLVLRSRRRVRHLGDQVATQLRLNVPVKSVLPKRPSTLMYSTSLRSGFRRTVAVPVALPRSELVILKVNSRSPFDPVTLP